MDQPALEARELRRSYGELVAVESFTARVEPGEVVVLVGPNGCGKTTSVEMAVGLRRSEGGSSRIAGHDVAAERAAVTKVLGVQLQGASLHARVRLREQAEYLGALYRVPGEPERVFHALGLGPVMDRVFSSLSGGMQRRALVAMAFAGRPRLVVLDEPTTGVDVESRDEIWTALRGLLVSRGTGALVTTHDLREAENHADRVLVMRHGTILAEGPPAELVARSGLRSVLTIRDRTGLNGSLPPRPPRHVVLRTSPFEVTLGFPRVKDASAYRELAGLACAAATFAERRPTFEDAYLAMGVAEEGAG